MFRPSAYRQRDATDCGACCLAYVAAHYGFRASISRVRQLAGTDQAGSTALGLVEAARALGLGSRGVKCTVPVLTEVPKPVIVHCLIDHRQHYVVLVGWSAKGAQVMDPALGRIERWPHQKFQAAWTGVLILLAPSTDFSFGRQSMPPWRRLVLLLRPHAKLMAHVFAGAILSTILGLSMSVYVQTIVDFVIPDGDRSLLNLLALGMLLVLGTKLLLGWFESMLALQVSQRIDATLILGYYRHLLRLPQSFFATMRVGEITSRIGDAVKIRQFLKNSLLSLLLNPLILVLSMVTMFLYSPKLALLSLALLPANACVYWAVNLLNREYQRRIMERAADFDAHLVESLQAQSLVRQFRLETEVALQAEHRLVRLLRATWQAGAGLAGSNLASSLLTQLYMIILLWLGAGLVLDAQLTPGELMSCYTLAAYLTNPLLALIGLNSSIQEALIATDRLFEVMDLDQERQQALEPFDRRHASAIRFEGVDFRHPGRSPTLHELNLTFRSGRVTVLAGDSGCGKSTVLALVQRLWLPTGGRIMIGDRDQSYFNLDSLRQHIAVMAQQTHLRRGTVLENLAPGDPRPDFDRIFELCRELEVLEFIEKLPQGFSTPLQENGANLSGGQRQRLAIVRALYLNAPILLCDEPTSALDPASEQRVLKRLRLEANAGKIVILAAHNAAALAAADEVVWLESGRVRPAAARSAATATAVAA